MHTCNHIHILEKETVKQKLELHNMLKLLRCVARG